MSIERALSKKRKIYGIDPDNYETQEQFYNDVNKIICEVCDKKINNISRHIISNIFKYKDLLLKIDPKFIYMSDDYEYYDEIQKFLKDDNLYKNFYKLLDYTKLYEDYLQYLLERDLDTENGVMSIINYVRKEIMSEPDLNRDEYGYYQKRPANILYLQIAQAIKNRECEISYSHPFIDSIKGSRKFEYDEWKCSSLFEKYIDILIHLDSLNKQKDYYKEIKQNSSNAIFEYIAKNNSWGAIMQKPYWIRLGRFTKRNSSHLTNNLFMIKPGTKTFDKSNIKYFVRKKDKKFKQKYDIKCEMMTITIPNSLDEESLLKVIDYVNEVSKDIKIVCQSTELANRVKSIIVQKELSSRIESGQTLEKTIYCPKKYYIKGMYWIYVDPKYYDSFFVNTPNNTNMWFKYTSENSLTKIDLQTLIDICIEKTYKENISSTNIHSTNDDFMKPYRDYIYRNEIYYGYRNKLLIDSINNEKEQKENIFTLVRKLKQ